MIFIRFWNYSAVFHDPLKFPWVEDEDFSPFNGDVLMVAKIGQQSDDCFGSSADNIGQIVARQVQVVPVPVMG